MQQLQGTLRGGLRPVVLAQYAKLSSSKAYSAADVQQHIRETAVAAFNIYPLVIAPGLLMLIGGLLLARTSRRQNVQNDA